MKRILLLVLCALTSVSTLFPMQQLKKRKLPKEDSAELLKLATAVSTLEAIREGRIPPKPVRSPSQLRLSMKPRVRRMAPGWDDSASTCEQMGNVCCIVSCGCCLAAGGAFLDFVDSVSRKLKQD